MVAFVKGCLVRVKCSLKNPICRMLLDDLEGWLWKSPRDEMYINEDGFIYLYS